MPIPDSIEKDISEPRIPCPFLPRPEKDMTYRDTQDRQSLFPRACAYANFLWMKGMPARAILALCRGIYLPPGDNPAGRIQPYRAYVWLLQHHRGQGFLGNPRISFARQATRIPSAQSLKIHRAWAMWYLSTTTLPDLPPDGRVLECPPSADKLARYLNASGVPGEGETFLTARNEARRTPIQLPGSVPGFR